jgi:penicillin amidase
VRPGRWTPVHSLAVVLLQGINQDAYFPQLQYAALAEEIGDSLAAAAWARAPLATYWTVEDSLARQPQAAAPPGEAARGGGAGAGAAALAVARLAAGVPPHGPGASNVWAVGGARMRRGAALLANDTHLALVAPSVWYAVHLTVPDSLEVTGLQTPGVPFVTSGRNRDVAWGITALGAMAFEAYRESLDASGRQALFSGRWEPIRSRALGLSYRLGPLRFPLFWIRARYTRHGVVESIDRRHRRAYAVRWAALEPWPSPPGDFGWERARTLEEFRSHLAGIYAPTLNWVAAERGGRILHQTAGWLPRRAYAPGLTPTPGFDGAHEWSGPVPLDSMPHVVRGPDGVIVNCNNPPSGPGTCPSVGVYASADWRARRVRELLGTRRGLAAADMEAMQGDALSPQWAVFGPVMLAQARAAARLDERERSILTALAAWDGESVPGKAEPAVFRAWWNELSRSLRAGGREALLLAVLRGEEPAAWLDKPAKPRRSGGGPEAGMTTADAVAAALGRARNGLTARLGADPHGWDWARAHRARFAHELEKRDASLTPRTVAVRGDRGTVCVGSVNLPRDTVVTFGPTLRVIFDLADSSGWFALPPGNSGDPDSPHYDDLLEAWAELRYRRLDLAWPTPAEIESRGSVAIPRPAGP